jgi:UDP-4-amino-4,6-dideoxy-N-acetyl-beta-L-altrosamine transaminase
VSDRPIPYGRHLIEEDDIRAVVEVLRGDWLTQGPGVERFERALSERCRAKHAVAASSATAALHLAMLAAGIGPGDEAVVPANTFLATANCAVYTGARPRFCDTDPLSGLASPAAIDAALRPETRAVLPVHFAGLPCDMAAISAIARAKAPRAVIVEDASHALGGIHPDGSPVGSARFADMVVFSFHPVKHAAAGEGGAVLTDRDDLAERLRRFRSHGMTKEPALLSREPDGPWYYEMPEPGFNYRIPDFACALAASQLGKLDRFLARRRELATRYHRELAGLPATRLPPPGDTGASAWHLYVLHVDFAAIGKPRTTVVEELRARGVLTQVHYYPVPLQPFYRKLLGHREGDFPGAERHYSEALTIPLFPGLSDADFDRVVAALREVLCD